MEFLHRRGPYASAPAADLVLLDLNLPRRMAGKVLADMKADSAFGSIPVVVLTSSKAEEDVAKAYALHANCYVTKPVACKG